MSPLLSQFNSLIVASDYHLIDPIIAKMSRIAKSVSQLMRMSVNQRLLSNSVQTTGKSLNQMRSISSVVISSKKLNSADRQTSVVSKRFAANSPQVDQELVQFLGQEIELEKKSQTKSLPSLKDWTVSTDGSNVVFEKKFGSEQITVKTNINHAVDQKSYGSEEQMPEDGSAEMVCRPEFAVEIKKGNVTLGINCAFVDPEDIEDETTANPDLKPEEKQALEDEFQINEFSLFDGEFKENSYAVSGDVMDGSMYDLMMDLLFERGVDQEFARSLVQYTTVYEHSLYVSLLTKLKDFLAQK